MMLTPEEREIREMAVVWKSVPVIGENYSQLVPVTAQDRPSTHDFGSVLVGHEIPERFHFRKLPAGTYRDLMILNRHGDLLVRVPLATPQTIPNGYGIVATPHTQVSIDGHLVGPLLRQIVLGGSTGVLLGLKGRRYLPAET